MRGANLWTTCRGGLVAAAFAIAPVACGEVPSDPIGPGEPPGGSSEITTQAAPEEGSFAVRVFTPETCENELVASGDDPQTFTVPTEETIRYCIKVEAIEPADADGSVVLSFCALPKGKAVGTLNTSSTSCTEQGGDGHWKRSRSLSGTGEWIFFSLLPSGIQTHGLRVQYRGMGSGVKNVTLPPFDVTRPANQ